MKKISLILLLFLILSSCGSTKSGLSVQKKSNGLGRYRSQDTKDDVVRDLGANYDIKSSSDQAEIDSIYQKMLETKSQKKSSGVKKVALLVPLSGKYSGIGGAIFDGVKMAMLDAGGDDIVLLPMDTDKTSTSELVSQIKSEEVDVVLGPVFSKEASDLMDSFSKVSAPMITFSNDKNLTKYRNIEIFGISPIDKLKMALKFAKDHGRMNVALLLKSDAGSQAVYQYVSDYVKKNKMALMSSAFYSEADARIAASVGTIDKNKAITYNIDKNGNPYLISLSAIQKNKNLNKNTDKQLRKLDIILTDAGGNMLDSLLSEMSTTGLLDKDIMIISLSDEVNVGVLNSGVYYVSQNNERYSVFKDLYRKAYKTNPTQFSALGYDAMGVIMTLMLRGEFSYSALHDDAGFVGVSGEFRFSNDRVVDRKYSIYKVANVRVEKVA